MSLSSRPMSGSAGVSTQTIWFNPVADRLTMLFSWDGNGNRPNNFPALFGNQFIPQHASFGAFTIAPDTTTNTAQLLQEDSSLNQHYCVATVTNLGFTGFNSYPRFRAGFIVQASGRRFAIQALTKSNNAGGIISTATVIFDLVGGQIGVAPTVVNPGGGSVLTAYNAEIGALGNNFYRCYLDFGVVYANSIGNWSLQINGMLDNGSGTGAASLNYTGNGTSGVYVWKAALLPLGAWGINNVSMFDDFLDTSTIDMTHSRTPGFNWYLDRCWPGWPNPAIYPIVTVPAQDFTVANSILNLGPNGSGNNGLEWNLSTAAPLDSPPGAYVGRGFKAPVLFEHSSKFPAPNTPGLPFCGTPGAHIVWTEGLEYIASQITTNPLKIGHEFDMGETGLAQPARVGNSWYYGNTNVVAQSNPSTYFKTNGGVINQFGDMLWASEWAWGNPAVDPFDNNRYSFTGIPFANPPSTQPHSDAGHWTLQAYSGQGVPGPGTWDYTQFHTYSELILPYHGSSPSGPAGRGNAVDPPDAVGMWMSFQDGLMVGTPVAIYSPVQGPGGVPNGYLQNTDGQQHLLILGCASNYTFQFDWVRVMQP